MEKILLGVSLIISFCTIAGFLIAIGKVLQRVTSHEILDNERHEANQEMLKEIRGDIKVLLQK